MQVDIHPSNEDDLRDMMDRDSLYESIGSIADMARRVLRRLEQATRPVNQALCAVSSLQEGDASAVDLIAQMLWHDSEDGMTAFEFEDAQCAPALLELSSDQLRSMFSPANELRHFAHSLQPPAGERDSELAALIIESSQLRTVPEMETNDDVAQAKISALEERSTRKYQPVGLHNLVSRLHDVIASTDMLPVWQFDLDNISWKSFSGQAFFGKPIEVHFAPITDSACTTMSQKFMVDGVNTTSEIEKLVLRNVQCKDVRYIQYCTDLVGYIIELNSRNSWRKARVLGFNIESGLHSLVFVKGPAHIGQGHSCNVLLSAADKYRIVEKVTDAEGETMDTQQADAQESQAGKLDIVVVRNAEARAGYTVHRNELVVAETERDSVAFQNGMRPGFRITHVDGEEVYTWQDYTRTARPKSEFCVTVSTEAEAVCAHPGEAVWFWLEQDGGRGIFTPAFERWRMYGDSAQELLHEAYADDQQGSVELETRSRQYIINFAEMQQINIDTGHERPIRRCKPEEVERSRRGRRRRQGECLFRTWNGFDLRSSEEKAREYSRGHSLERTQSGEHVDISFTQAAGKTPTVSAQLPIKRPNLTVVLRFGGFGIEKDNSRPTRAKALNDFFATPEMDGYYKPLEFKAGDILEIVSREPGGGWWTGKLNGKRGLIPADYCKVESEPDAADRQQVSQMLASPKLMRPHQSLLSTIMGATEVEGTDALAGIWRVEISCVQSEPEELLWLLGYDQTNNEYVGARLDGGRLTQRIAGHVTEDSTFRFRTSERQGQLRRTQGSGILHGSWSTLQDEGSTQQLRAARVGDANPQVAIPAGAICNIEYDIMVSDVDECVAKPHLPFEIGTRHESKLEPEPGHEPESAIELEPAQRTTGFKRLSATETFSAALAVLARLYTDEYLRERVNVRAFHNPAMTRKLEEQLLDPIAVATGAFPSWCSRWVREAPFLFTRSLRERFLHATSFGPTRALVQLNSAPDTGDEMSSGFRGAAWHLPQQPMPELKSDKWIVRRDPPALFLDDVFAALSKRILSDTGPPARSRLEVNLQWRVGGVGDAFTGAGLGVHVQFYTEVARAIESRQEQDRLHMWMDEADAHPVDSLAKTSADSRIVTDPARLPPVGARLVDAVAQIQADVSIGAADKQAAIRAWLSSRNGTPTETSADCAANESQAEDYSPLQCALYPRPVTMREDVQTVEVLCTRFRLLGWLMATALMERQLLPLQLHPLFFDVALGRVPVSPLPVFQSGDTSNGSECWQADWVVTLQRLVMEGSVRGAGVLKWVLHQWTAPNTEPWPDYLAEVRFVDPGISETTGSLPWLVDGGDSRTLTRDNIREYLALMYDRWLGSGVERQMEAFRAGFAEVVPLGLASIIGDFSTDEVVDMLCGAAVSWDERTLRECVVPAPQPPTYSSGDPEFEWLISELLQLTPSARSNFLNFVTARKRLPGGDLRNLPPLAASATSSRSRGSRQSTGERRITVDASSGAAPLMKGSTCNYRLHMPRGYASQAELGMYLARSIEESSGMHD